MATQSTTTSNRSGNHHHRWTLFDPFYFDGLIYVCDCGEKRLELDSVTRTSPLAPDPPSRIKTGRGGRGMNPRP